MVRVQTECHRNISMHTGSGPSIRQPIPADLRLRLSTLFRQQDAICAAGYPMNAMDHGVVPSVIIDITIADFSGPGLENRPELIRNLHCGVAYMCTGPHSGLPRTIISPGSIPIVMRQVAVRGSCSVRLCTWL